MRMMLAAKAVVSVSAVVAAGYITRASATGLQPAPPLFGATAIADGHFDCCNTLRDQNNFWDPFFPTTAGVTPNGITTVPIAPQQDGAFASVGGLSLSGVRRDQIFLHGSVYVSGSRSKFADSISSWRDTVTFTCNTSPTCTYHATLVFRGQTTGTSTPRPDSANGGYTATGTATISIGGNSATLSSDDTPIGVINSGAHEFNVTKEINWTFVAGQTTTFLATIQLGAITIVLGNAQTAALNAMDTFEFFLDPVTEGASYTTASGLTYLTPADTRLDTVAPTTTASLSAPPNANGWAAGDVAVSLNAVDNMEGSGVKQITYSLDGPLPTPSTVVQGNSAAVTAGVDGVSTLTFFAEDNANNVEVANTLKIQIDKTAPSISSTRTPAANVNDWNNSAVTVTIQCSDALSGLAAGSPPSPVSVSTQGVGQTIQGTCTDLAGNFASLTVRDINIDLTAPTISGSRTPAANANGWSKSPVTVTFQCADGLSGLADGSPPAPSTLAGEGTSQSVLGSCTDLAGNKASASVQGINIDLTAPAITVAARSPLLWPPSGRVAPDIISGVISDGLSGVDPSAATFKVIDKYGQIQPTGPIAIGAGGVYSFTVNLEASRLDEDLDGRTYQIVVSASDRAGNQTSASTVVTVPHDQRQ
jgi:hypothetical protein